MTISTDEATKEITIAAYLDRMNPLTEARWVKTGDVEAWIAQLAVTNGTASKWKGKITVSDPDPVSLLVAHSFRNDANSLCYSHQRCSKLSKRGRQVQQSARYKIGRRSSKIISPTTSTTPSKFSSASRAATEQQHLITRPKQQPLGYSPRIFPLRTPSIRLRFR